MSLKGKRRIEGYTRTDNTALISVLKKCNFVKEAPHREYWPDENGHYFDSVGYAILKSDWENNNVTPLNW
ncbi:GNAT family N-acetyltransferase [Candidatus Riflebacteria bacterium]